jgi:hypothetical protein
MRKKASKIGMSIVEVPAFLKAQREETLRMMDSLSKTVLTAGGLMKKAWEKKLKEESVLPTLFPQRRMVFRTMPGIRRTRKLQRIIGAMDNLCNSKNKKAANKVLDMILEEGPKHEPRFDGGGLV